MTRSSTPRWVHRSFALFAALAMMVALLPQAAGGQEGPQRPGGGGSPPEPSELAASPEFADELWFVELSSEPTARGGSTAALARERSELQRQARTAGIDYEQRFDYRRLWNGLSVRATASEAQALAELRAAVAVYPVELIEGPRPQDGIDPQLGTALGMTGADVVASEMDHTGAGLSVAVVDTGIDYGHPDLGGDGAGTTFPTDRVTHGFDYVGDDYNAADPDNDTPQPDPDPMDVNGHGTHVAGIVGASPADDDGVTGVAPGVTFGAYKVFGTTGSSTADVIIEAMEDAHEDGMDIINMSLGAGFAWGDYPTSQVANQLVADGTVLVVSAGNEGDSGLFSLGAPGNASDVIGVASADNLFMNALVMEVEGLDVDGSDDLPYTGIGGAELPPTEGESDPIVWIGRACAPDDVYDGETDELEGDPEGSVALIVRGECTFATKYERAVDAGATGVIIHNHLPGMFAGGGIDGVDGIWAAATTNAHGTALHDLVEGSTDAVTATFTDRSMQVANPTGGLLSSFTSYGMTPDLVLKPDITAPGGLIESTYPLASGTYATLSGTSMAAPHVAGGVALLLDARPGLAADEVKTVLQNSADPLAWSLAPAAGFLDHTFRQGAGMLRIDASITATTSVTPSSISLGESAEVSTTLTVANDGDEAVTYVLGHEGTVGTGGFGDPPGDWYSIFDPLGAGAFAGPTTGAAFGDDTVTVPAGSSATVEVTITNPDVGLYAHQAGGYLTLTEEGADEPSLVVPFAGLAGDLADIELWPEEREEAVGLDNQLVARWTVDEAGEPVLVPADPGHRFRRGEQPVAAVFMGFAAEHLEVVAHHVDTGLEVPVAEVEYARRSATYAEYLPYTWDGRLAEGQANVRRPAPGGQWRFVVRALMPRVSPDDPEVWVEDSSYTFHLSGRPDRQPGPPPGRGRNP